MTTSLTTDQGQALLELARGAIARALGIAVPRGAGDGAGDAARDAARDLARDGEGDWLREPGAAFVTLTRNGELRGCIGSLEPRRALADDVEQNAVAAALRDPRFPPLGPHELDSTSVEVSVLTRPEPLPVADEAEARARLRPHVDGVVLVAGPRRSTFLPQVWEDLPDPADFLAQLKRKAGLPARGWPPGAALLTYQVTKFAEPPRQETP